MSPDPEPEERIPLPPRFLIALQQLEPSDRESTRRFGEGVLEAASDCRYQDMISEFGAVDSRFRSGARTATAFDFLVDAAGDLLDAAAEILQRRCKCTPSKGTPG